MDFNTGVMFVLNNPFVVTAFYREENNAIVTYVRVHNYGSGSPAQYMGWGRGETYEVALTKAVEEMCNVKKRQAFDIRFRPWANTPKADAFAWK